MNGELRVGGRIVDKTGMDWTVTYLWQFENFLCMSLIGTFDRTKMGGHRIELFRYQDINFNH